MGFYGKIKSPSKKGGDSYGRIRFFYFCDLGALARPLSGSHFYNVD